MEKRDIAVTLISAQDLKKVTAFGQQTCYAVAYVDVKEKKATRVDKRGGVAPTWDSKLVLTYDESLVQREGSFLTVDIYNYGPMSNKLVGTVKVPLRELAAGRKDNQPTFMAYEVRRPSGKARGVLNLSVKLGEKRTVTAAPRAGKQQQYPNAYPSYMVDYMNPRQDVPMQYAQSYPPPMSGARVDSVAAYPPMPSTQAVGAANAASVYPPPKESSSYAAGDNAPSVYPPPKDSAGKTSTSSSGSSSDAKMEEPVLAYPATGYAAYSGQQYGAGYGSQFGGRQQYYPSAQANAPYSYQQAYYSKPPKKSGGGGVGLGLLGGALGGLLLGDLVGDFGGF